MKEYRFKANPEEQRIIEQFIKERGTESGICNFVGDVIFNDRLETTGRDVQVFTGAIQWLGSPVGQSFLKRLGYDLRDSQDKLKNGTWIHAEYGTAIRTFYIINKVEKDLYEVGSPDWRPIDTIYLDTEHRYHTIIGHTEKRWWRQYLPAFIARDIHPYPKP